MFDMGLFWFPEIDVVCNICVDARFHRYGTAQSPGNKAYLLHSSSNIAHKGSTAISRACIDFTLLVASAHHSFQQLVRVKCIASISGYNWCCCLPQYFVGSSIKCDTLTSHNAASSIGQAASFIITSYNFNCGNILCKCSRRRQLNKSDVISGG